MIKKIRLVPSFIFFTKIFYGKIQKECAGLHQSTFKRQIDYNKYRSSTQKISRLFRGCHAFLQKPRFAKTRPKLHKVRVEVVIVLFLSGLVFFWGGTKIFLFFSSILRGRRVTGLPIRGCTESPNNLVSRDVKINATAMTAKGFFESLYLVPGLHQLLPFVTMPSKPTFPPLAWRLFLDFRAIFFPSGPSTCSQARFSKLSQY